eukprot:COSAG04_NODE_1628_length_6114_cov_17.732502_3_plen_182_part_00
MALASICSPAFDRNEAIALMGCAHSPDRVCFVRGLQSIAQEGRLTLTTRCVNRFVEQYAANRAVATSLLRASSNAFPSQRFRRSQHVSAQGTSGFGHVHGSSSEAQVRRDYTARSRVALMRAVVACRGWARCGRCSRTTSARACSCSTNEDASECIDCLRETSRRSEPPPRAWGSSAATVA